jgi:hypothetical protein
MSTTRNNALQFSSVGSKVLGDSDEITNGRIGAIQVVTATEFSTLTAANVDQSDQVLTGSSIPAGTVLYGEFTDVTVNTGLAICHKY